MSKMPTRATASGVTLPGATLKTLMLAVIDALNSYGYQEGNRSTVTTTSTLTITQAGLVLVDCTSGNVVLTLPASGATGDDALYTIRRIDATANTLTVQRGGADTVEGAATGLLVFASGVLALQMPAGATNWRVVSMSGATAAASRAMLGAAASGANTDITSLLASAIASPSSPFINGTIVHSRAGNAETIAIKTLAGADPSATSPVAIVIRNTAAGSGDYTILSLTAATSIVISSGSTMGALNSTAFRLWLVAFNDAGTARLGVIKAASSAGIYPLAGFGIASSTAEGGAGAADNAQTFYTGVAVASKPYTVLGYSTWESGLAAAGTWGTAPTRVQLFGPGVRLPGDRIQVVYASGGGLSSASTAYVDVTNATANITLSSAANAVKSHVHGFAQAPNVATFNVGYYLKWLEGGTTLDGDSLLGGASAAGNTTAYEMVAFDVFSYPNSAAAVTYKLQQKASNQGAAETVTTGNVKIILEEVMV